MAKANETSSVTPGVDIPDYVAQNYRGLVADENRSVTFKSIEKQAKAEGDAALAAWARAEAAKSGKDVTPSGARPSPGQVKRDADKAAKAAGSDTHVKTADETGQVDATDSGGTPPTGVPVDYNEHTVDELKDLVAQREGIDPAGLKLKADYVAALELDDEGKATS